MEKKPQVIVEVNFWDKLSFHLLSKKPNNRKKKILPCSLTIADHSDSDYLHTDIQQSVQKYCKLQILLSC